MDYRDEMKQLTNPLRENMKVFGKKIVGFLRDYGECMFHVSQNNPRCLHILVNVFYTGLSRA